MKTIVTGGTGFVGRRLLERLPSAAVLARSPERARRALGDRPAFSWDALAGPPPQEAFEGVEVVYHLAGENIAGRRWTPAFKRRIRESRVVGTRHLVDALRVLPVRPHTLIAASAIGFYGSRGESVLDETVARGDGFLAEVCEEWEGESRRAEELGVRVILLRIGLVLDASGGPLQKMLLPFRLGLGARIGNGRQWMSWIHRDDLVGLCLHAATAEGLQGPVNAVAPEPSRNAEFTRTLARALRRPAFLWAPVPALRLAFGEVANETAYSTRVVPRLALESGFEFRYPTLREALAAIFPRRASTERSPA